MVYEMRTYWAAEGKLERLHERFRQVTLEVFERHGMHLVGFWTPCPITPETGDLIYILSFPSEEARVAAWAAFRADPQWIEGRSQSEVDGKLANKVVSVLMDPIDFSPLQ